ncbi:unnamed protein product, partial [Musa hybrid cultivar]
LQQRGDSPRSSSPRHLCEASDPPPQPPAQGCSPVSELLRLGNPDGCSGKKEGRGVVRDEGLCNAPDSRHVFAIGVLEQETWPCLFRFKIWWMIPRTGKKGSDIPLESQMLLLEAKEDVPMEDKMVDSTASTDTFDVLLLPVLDGAFRANLQGNSANEVEIYLETG